MSSASQLGRDRPLVLVVMDGVGIGRGDEGDAVALARTPILDDAPGPRRPLPHPARPRHRGRPAPDDGDMGNSEVGHNALGAGRVFDQGAKLVNRAIASGGTSGRARRLAPTDDRLPSSARPRST